MIYLAVLIIIVYILKNLFLIYVYELQYKFAYYGKKQMQNELMRYYIGKDYTFFLNVNSSELIRNINTDPGNVLHSGAERASAIVRSFASV